MNTMTYKGYIGSIEICEEDNCLYGKVMSLPDNTLISYEGETVAELREDFHTSVDDYIAQCEAEGQECCAESDSCHAIMVTYFIGGKCDRLRFCHVGTL